MKPKGRHPDRALTAVKVKALKEPGRHADGNGLYVIVEPSGAKRWMLRIMVQGRRRDLGLGGVQLVSLAEAREQAANLRKMAKAGIDPIADRKTKAGVPTFAEAAHQVYAQRAAAWSNAKHKAQWINTLTAYVFPIFGDRRVHEIDTPDVLRALSPIWLRKPETARRVRQRIRAVFDWAKAAGFRSGENPVEGVAKGLPKQPDHENHHAALPIDDMPQFIGVLRKGDASEPVKLAFELLILTATRTSDVLEATWSEFHIQSALWTIPKARTKTKKRAHRVPLTPRCLKILEQAKQLASQSEYVFPGQSLTRPLSDMVFLMTLRRMELEITPHGFRSTFKDWASERTNFPNEISEMALQHSIGNKSEAAYRRGDLFEKRRKLMTDWAKFASPQHSQKARRGSKSKVKRK